MTAADLILEIRDKRNKQADIARYFAQAIESGKITDWHLVCKTIIARWSRSGLKRIKKMAWKILDNE